jgi:hypothetical protein
MSGAGPGGARLHFMKGTGMATLLREKTVSAPAPSASIRLRDPDVMKRIAETAYYLWQKRGSPHGSDLQDWSEAEKIVLGRRNG